MEGLLEFCKTPEKLLCLLCLARNLTSAHQRLLVVSEQRSQVQTAAAKGPAEFVLMMSWQVKMKHCVKIPFTQRPATSLKKVRRLAAQPYLRLVRHMYLCWWRHAFNPINRFFFITMGFLIYFLHRSKSEIDRLILPSQWRQQASVKRECFWQSCLRGVRQKSQHVILLKYHREGRALVSLWKVNKWKLEAMMI